jgi:integrase/recombinase XerD
MNYGSQVRIIKRVKFASGWQFATVARDAKDKPRWDYVLVGDTTEHHPEGSYYLDYRVNGRRTREAVGTDHHQVVDAAKRKGLELQAIKAGLIAAPVFQQRSDHTALRGAVNDYLAWIEAHRSLRTYRAYRPVLEEFLSVTKKAYLKDIGRDDLNAFDMYCATQMGRNGVGEQGTTRYHKLVIVTQMLKRYGITGLLSRADWPKRERPRPRPYKDEDLKKLFPAVSERDRIIYKAYLMTGFRDRELTHTAWDDVDFERSLISVTAKPHFRFQPKDHEERTVPLADELKQMLLKWKPRSARSGDLVFPNSNGRPDGSVHERLKEYAWKLGLNCGRCEHPQKLKDGTIRLNKCKEGPHCSQWGLHGFRHSYSTAMLQSGVDVVTLQHYLGHADLNTTVKYVRKLGFQAAHERVRAMGVFAQWSES